MRPKRRNTGYEPKACLKAPIFTSRARTARPCRRSPGFDRTGDGVVCRQRSRPKKKDRLGEAGGHEAAFQPQADQEFNKWDDKAVKGWAQELMAQNQKLKNNEIEGGYGSQDKEGRSKKADWSKRGESQLLRWG